MRKTLCLTVLLSFVLFGMFAQMPVSAQETAGLSEVLPEGVTVERMLLADIPGKVGEWLSNWKS